jgi:hypothetical protein
MSFILVGVAPIWTESYELIPNRANHGEKTSMSFFYLRASPSVSSLDPPRPSTPFSGRLILFPLLYLSPSFLPLAWG